LASAQARFQPVWVGDVVSAMLSVLNARQRSVFNPLGSPPLEAVYELAGPEVKTFAELVRLAGEHIGHPRPILPLPSGIARLQAFLMEMMPGQPVMSRDNLDSMLTPNVASARYPGLEALGVLAPKSLLSVFPPSPAQRRD
jgi:NADH dehydrogenase